nr:zinc finger and BTB domain-containing protein 41 [Drosophila takahashii]
MHCEKYTPEIRELLPVREHRCPRCPNLVFGNLSHYQLHLRQRHQEVLPTLHSGGNTAFHCPAEKCIYHVATKGARSFTSLRLLRQHYQKSHLDKKYKCQECGEKFLLQHHLEKHKCEEHRCPVCELTYNSKASLRTHMRRKNHLVEQAQESEKVAIPTLANWRKLNPVPANPAPVEEVATILTPQEDYISSNLAVVTEFSAEPANISSTLDSINELPPEEHILCFLPIMDVPYELSSQKLDMETQTEEDDLNEIRNEVLAPLLRDIETQTPDTRGDIGTMTDDFPDEQEQSQMTQPVPVGSHFPTYSENEPMFDLQTSAHMYTQTCDDLFEELGLSHIQTQTHWPDGGLYNTQHTQTCDEIMDELFPDNFQSTCTQTMFLDWQDTGEGES